MITRGIVSGADVKTTSLKELKDLYQKAKEAYYHSDKPLMSDAKFDKLEDLIRSKDPQWIGLKKTGTKVGKKTSATLTYPMPSLGKIKSEDDSSLNRFLSNLDGSDVLIMPKIDGNSVLLTYHRGSPVSLITRGDGITGKDISHFIPFLGLPEINNNANVVMRCEIVLNNKVYQTKWSEEFDNPRNQVAGILNRQDAHPSLGDLEFVVLRVMSGYGILDADLKATKLSCPKGKLKFIPCKRVTTSKVNRELLLGMLESAKEKMPYDLDGLVIHSGQRVGHTEERPKFATAWKHNSEEDEVTTTVRYIEWNASRHGILIPKAKLETVKVHDVKVTNVTLSNAKWAKDRGIGEGAVVKIRRSGDVIPQITQVLKKGKFTVPSTKEFGDYDWDENGTHLVLKKATESSTVKAKRIARYYAALGIEFIGEGVAKKMVDAGFDTVVKAANMTKANFLKLEGFGEQAATRAYLSIQKAYDDQVSLPSLMVASGIFPKGVGTTFLHKVIAHNPKLVYKSDDYTPNQLREGLFPIKGLTYIFVDGYTENIESFWKFYEKVNVPFKPYTKPAKTKGKLTGIGGTWTGYRNANEEAWFQMNGGEVVPFGSKTNVLFYLPSGKTSSKIEKAKEKGIQVVVFDKYQKTVKG
jgi:DNA ligase (NAD+)